MAELDGQTQNTLVKTEMILMQAHGIGRSVPKTQPREPRQHTFVVGATQLLTSQRPLTTHTQLRRVTSNLKKS